MNATSERTAFLRSIIADPADDTRRLAFADWCDENGEPERAEFIRIQIELETLWSVALREIRERPNNASTFDMGFMRMYLRQRTLKEVHRAEWLSGPKCKGCDGRGSFKATSDPHGLNRRQCEACHGTGDACGLTWEFRYPDPLHRYSNNPKPERVRVTFRRGFPAVVTVPRLADAITEVSEREKCRVCHGFCPANQEPYERDNRWVWNCFGCDGTGIVGAARPAPTPWLAAVVKHHPVTDVVSLDFEQFLMERAGMFWWRDDVVYDNAPRLPAAICPKCEYQSREVAISALARAVASFARSSSLADAI